MSLRQRIGQEVASLVPPRIVRAWQYPSETPPRVGLSEAVELDRLTLSIVVVPDVIAPLMRYLTPSILEAPQPTLDVGPTYSLLDDPAPALSEELIAGELRIGYPSCNQEGYNIDLLSPVPITDPVSLTDDLTLNPPEIVTVPSTILPHVSIMGMNYRDRIWRDITPEYDQWPPPEKKQRQPRQTRPNIAPKDDAATLHPEPPEPKSRFWDDVYLLLQPPIVLDFGGQIGSPHPLYDFQPDGIQFLLNNEGALLADEMGTGKTVMTTVALRILFQQGKIRRALILCPVSVLREWGRHLSEWAPALEFRYVRGTRRERIAKWKMPTHVYVTTYSTFRNDLRRSVLPAAGAEAFDAVVLDEAQYIKSPTSGRTRATKQLKANYRWALSGTPVENKLEDLISIFDFLHPDYLSPDDLNPERIKERIKPYFLRRRKIDVLPDLPPKQHQDFWLALDANQRKAYDRVESEIRSEFSTTGRSINKVHIFSAITRLKQICNFAPGKLTSSKVRLLIEQVEEIAANEQKVLIFTQFIGEGLSKLEKALTAYNLTTIKGGQSDRERAAQVARFKRTSAREVPILLASVKAAGVGLNLKEATYVIHFDHWWNPAVMWQAEDRAHRADQTHGVNVYSYWIEDTIEERIYDVLSRKHLLFESVVDDLSEEQIEARISDAEWLDIILGDKAGKASENRLAGSADADPDTGQLSLEEIRYALLELPPTAFEQLTSELFRHLGYPNVRVTGRTADGGVDVIAQANVRQGGERVVIQCKRYQGSVGVKVARELRGVMAADTSISGGYLVTSGTFTRQCEHFCGTENISLISGIQLANYVRQYNLRLDGY